MSGFTGACFISRFICIICAEIRGMILEDLLNHLPCRGQAARTRTPLQILIRFSDETQIIWRFQQLLFIEALSSKLHLLSFVVIFSQKAR